MKEDQMEMHPCTMQHTMVSKRLYSCSWSRSQCDRTCTYFAAQLDNKKVAVLLLQKGPDPNVEGPNGWTPLHYAAQKNRKEVCQVAPRERSWSQCGRNRWKDTLVLCSSPYTSKDVADLLLLEKGADPDVEAQNRMAPLEYAVLHDNREVAGLLTDKGADPNLKGTDR